MTLLYIISLIYFDAGLSWYVAGIVMYLLRQSSYW